MTTQKVLILSKEEGLEYSQWVKTKPSMDQKKKVADLLLKLFIREFIENRLVQTDPNPANFLVRKDGRLVLIDFGATLPFSHSFVKDYQTMVRKVFSKDRRQILEQVFALNFLDPREEVEVQQTFVDFLLLSMQPFEVDQQPFDFSSSEYGQSVRSEALKFTRQLRYSAPPKDLIFLNRKLGGIFMLLRRLEIQADLSEFRELILNNDY